MTESIKKQIMIAVDDSNHSKYAVQYAASISSSVNKLSYVLFNMQPSISQFLVDEARTSFKAQIAIDKLTRKNKIASMNILEKHKARMIEMGIKEDRIEMKTQPKKLGLAKDILDYAQEHMLDAIVVGRRGLSKLQEVLMGSLTSKLLEYSTFVPVWVVDGGVISNNIMLAIDGSEYSLRAVDHLAFMIRNNPKIELTLFHVKPEYTDYCRIDFDEADKDIKEIVLQTDQKCVDNFFVHARKKFIEAGIKESQIRIKEIESVPHVGKAIVEEVCRGNYGTVILGRRGAHRAFFIGSISKYVLERTTSRALWLVS